MHGKHPKHPPHPLFPLGVHRRVRRRIHQPARRSRSAGAALVAVVTVLTVVTVATVAALAGLLAASSFTPVPVSARPSERVAPAARRVQKVTLGETSIDGPALNGGLTNRVLGWTGTDAAHHLNLMTRTGDDLSFGNKLTLAETSPFRPAVAEANVDSRGPFVVVAWTGTDAAHTLNVLWNAYGAPGSPRRKLTLRGETSIGAPGFAALSLIGERSSPLELAWTGTDANHSLNILPLAPETLTPGKKVILSQFSSNAGPNLSEGFRMSDVLELVLAWTSRTQRLNLATSTDGVQFSVRPDPTIQAELSAAAPSPAVREVFDPVVERSWLAWTGTDAAHHLNLRTTTDFPQWGAGTKTVLVDTALGGPQIAGFDSRVFLAWTGTDARHHLNVALFEPA